MRCYKQVQPVLTVSSVCILRYLLDAMHEEERVPSCPSVPAAPSTAPPPARTAVSPRAQDDTSVPGRAAAERPRPRRRHRSCDTAPAPGGTEPPPPSPVPLSDLFGDDVVMAEAGGGGSLVGGAAADVDTAQPTGDDGHSEDDSMTRTGGCSDTRTDPDGEAATGDVAVGDSEERTGAGAGAAGDCGDVGTVDAGDSPGQSAEPAAGLVRRLLTGRAETTYTCCACGAVSRHVDRMTDLHLALPEAVTRPLTAAAAAAETGNSQPVFGPEPRPADWEGPLADPGPKSEALGGTEPAVQPDPDPAPQFGPEPAPQSSPEPAPQFGPEQAPQFGPEQAPQSSPEPAPQSSPESAPQFGPEPAPQFGPAPQPMQEETSPSQPEMDLNGELCNTVLYFV